MERTQLTFLKSAVNTVKNIKQALEAHNLGPYTADAGKIALILHLKTQYGIKIPLGWLSESLRAKFAPADESAPAPPPPKEKKPDDIDVFEFKAKADQLVAKIKRASNAHRVPLANINS